MALYADINDLRQSVRPEFAKDYPCGATVEKSGIYRCIICGGEAACNAGDPFPPQNEHRHESLDPPKWRLIVATQS